MTGWTVYTSWRAHRSLPAVETRDVCPDWPTARRHALNLACLAGSRYVSVQGPGDVVAGEWDAYTNRWREYRWRYGVCGSEREPDGVPCTALLVGALTATPQIRCGTCGAWHGVLSRPEWHRWLGGTVIGWDEAKADMTLAGTLGPIN